MRRHSLEIIGILLLCLPILAAETEAPAFTKKPVASSVGGKTEITFAVNRETDVAVYIEDAKGKVIRHLVAGVLGKNPPAPLKANSLEQTVVWDGLADYGKPAEGGPFKVRVGIGLGAKYDSILSPRQPRFSGASALGVGADGTVYVRHTDWPAGNDRFSHWQLVALERDGTYRRTLMPYAATPDNREAAGHETLTLGNAQVPVILSERDMHEDLNARLCGSGCSVAVTRDGNLVYTLTPKGILSLKTAGGVNGVLEVPYDLKPALLNGSTSTIAITSNDKYLLLSGLLHASSKQPATAVYRVNAADRTGMSVFYGDPEVAGSDETHLGANPGGMCVDGQGRVLIADTANNRIVIVDEETGKYQGALKFDKPMRVGTASKQGALYVLSAAPKLRVVKLTAAGAPKPDWAAAQEGYHWMVQGRTEMTYALAIDASDKNVVLWFGSGYMGNMQRLEDTGTKLEPLPTPVTLEANDGYNCIAVDRNTKEVYARNGNYTGRWERFNDETGKSEVVTVKMGSTPNLPNLIPSPSGNLYGTRWPFFFFQVDRNGKPVPFAEPRRMPTEEETKLNFPSRVDKNKIEDSLKTPSTFYAAIAMGASPHTLGMHWNDGHLFLFEPYLFSKDGKTPNEGNGGRTLKALHEYTPDGKRITTLDKPIIWKVTDAALGPKFDAAGNIYIADVIRPKGWTFPPELKPYTEAKGNKPQSGNTLPWPSAGFAKMYGSIVKFSPKGGTIEYTRQAFDQSNPYEGTPKLDGMNTIEGDAFTFYTLWPTKVIGAEWVHPGIGHVGIYACNCENTMFDVDEFGRSFFPDFCMYQIRVIDTAGNSILNFGGYGNADNCGPDSMVLDAQTGKLRPRKADDPASLKSPFAAPEIAMAWPVGVGVTDKHAYIGDAVNRRLLRAKLVYAAEELCPIK